MKIQLPSIVRRGDSVTPVKNLGWLLRNWRDVSRFEILPHPPGAGADCILVAHLKSGGTYETGYACKSILRDFLHRPVFFNLSVSAPAFGGYFPPVLLRGAKF